MKRFWRDVALTGGAGGWRIALDGRPVRTPGRVPLSVPIEALGEAIAEEWRAVGETFDPRAMRLTGLANAAIDRVAPHPAGFAAGLARYAASDLLCYRADGPVALLARQAALWDPLLAWARGRYDVNFVVTTGIVPVAQPTATLARLGEAVASLGAFELAALSPLVSVGGSLVAALALVERAIDRAAMWRAVRIDDDWQAEHWGRDDLAEAAAAAHRADFDAGAQMLALLRD